MFSLRLVSQRLTSQRLASLRLGLVNPSLGKLIRGRLVAQNTGLRHFSSFHPRYDKSRMTKATLLARAKGPMSRFWVHLKWPLTRGNRPLSLDDFSAFVSWFVVGNILFLAFGTTKFGLATMYSLYTFESIRFKIRAYFIDDERDEDKRGSLLSRATSSILSYGLGARMEFRDALPSYDDGLLTFKNVKFHAADSKGDYNFVANVKKLCLSLSFNKWYEGKGVINEIEIYGLNGRLDKYEPLIAPVVAMSPSEGYSNTNNHFQFDMGDHNEEELKKVAEARSKRLPFINPDYELEGVKIHDSYVEVSQDCKAPLKISIFNCDLPKVRRSGLLVDLFNAKNVTGAINDSMFTIHKRQSKNTSDDNTVRFKLDGINLAAIATDRFNWLVDGRAEIMADITIPQSDSEGGYKLKNEYKKLSRALMDIFNEITKRNDEKNEAYTTFNNKGLVKSAIAAIYETFTNPYKSLEDSDPDLLQEYVMVELKVKVSDLMARLPQKLPFAQSSQVPFISLHDIRSLIAFVNEHRSNKRPPIVVKAHAIDKLSEFEKCDTLNETKICDSLAAEIYEELLKMAKMDEERILQNKFSMWSHSIASQLLLVGLGVMV